MTDPSAPKWLRFLSRRLGWVAIPQIAILLVTLQAIGFVFVYMDPIWWGRLALIPSAVKDGEVWRLITFLALPVSLSPIWILFSLWFLYFVTDLIESRWGAFQTTFYLLMSIVLTGAFSLGFDIPVGNATDFSSTLFLAAAGLYPDLEIRIYFAIPVKLKYLGWLTLAYVAWRFLQAGMMERFYLLVIYSNYGLFFGPALVSSLKDWNRRRAYRSKLR